MDTLTTPPVVTGTTLAVLAPYLPYGIEVQTPRLLGKLIGLNSGGFQCPVETQQPEDDTESILNGLFNYDYADVLPVLRPFSALCDPLPDGTVPAVEVAKLALGNNENIDFADFNTHDLGSSLGVNFSGLATPCVMVGKSKWTLCWMDSDSNMQPAQNQVAIVDYLRSQHFALPVNGRPLVEGVDFIAKQ